MPKLHYIIPHNYLIDNKCNIIEQTSSYIIVPSESFELNSTYLNDKILSTKKIKSRPSLNNNTNNTNSAKKNESVFLRNNKKEKNKRKKIKYENNFISINNLI